MISTIVFFGDSITAAGKNAEQPLGQGYVYQISQVLARDNHLNRKILINSGINGTPWAIY